MEDKKEIEKLKKELSEAKQELKRYRKIRRIDEWYRHYDYANESENELALRSQLNEVIDRINESDLW